MSINYDDIELEHQRELLAEAGKQECEWHPGQPDWPECYDCQALYEQEMENRMDADREERG